MAARASAKRGSRVKIYTKTGDKGDTGLFGGLRVSKASLRVEAYGTLDELNCALGMARSDMADRTLGGYIECIQHELFSLGAELAVTPGKHTSLKTPMLGVAAIEKLERQIDDWEAQLTPLRQFILPGGTKAAACLHYARAVCRRAERVTVRLTEQEPVRREILVYLNRLSDWLFVFARVANHSAAHPDIVWVP